MSYAFLAFVKSLQKALLLFNNLLFEEDIARLAAKVRCTLVCTRSPAAIRAERTHWLINFRAMLEGTKVKTLNKKP
jgi:hypothetical protein